MAESRIGIFNRCLGLILGPIARFCLSHSIKFQDFSEAAKRAFLAEAKKEMDRLHLDQTIVRLSVMTGLQRRDVTRLQKNKEDPGEDTNVIGRVIGQWAHDSRYQDAKGKPRALDIEGKDSEFAQMVHAVSKDLNSYAVLFELERLGNIVRKDNLIRLRKATFEPRGNLAQSYAILADDARDLIYAVEENVASADGPINLHSRTEYDNVDPKAAAKIRLWFLKRGQRFHTEARKFISRFDKDINPDCRTGGVKVVLGSFSHVEEPSAGRKMPRKSGQGKKSRHNKKREKR